MQTNTVSQPLTLVIPAPFSTNRYPQYHHSSNEPLDLHRQQELTGLEEDRERCGALRGESLLI
jgi:hypothetical protein